MNNKLFTIQEVANILGVSTKTLRRWDQRGRLVATRTVGNQRRYSQQQIDELRNPSASFGSGTHRLVHPSASDKSSRQEGSGFTENALESETLKVTHSLPSVLSQFPCNSILRHHFLLKEKETQVSSSTSLVIDSLKEKDSPTAGSGHKANAFKMGFIFTILVLVFSLAGAGVLTKYNVIAGLNEKKDQFAKFINSLPEISLSIKPRNLSFVPQDGNQAVLAASTGDSSLLLNINVPSIFAESSAFLKHVGVGVTTPDASAILDLSSEEKGFLAPRMTEAQVKAIDSPATGLFVYNTTTNEYNMFNGKLWRTIGAVTAIGDVTIGDAFSEKGTSGTALYFNGTSGGKVKVTASSISDTKTLTLPNATGTFVTTGNLTAITTVGTITSGVWNGTTIAVANGGTGVTTSTGTGNVVLSAAPTFTTSITNPLVIGGTGTTSTLTLRSTSGAGAAGADIIFQTGNNGATEAMRILNSGNVGIGTSSATGVFHVSGAVGGNAAAIINNAGTVGDIFTASSSGTSRFVITNTGNVGIANMLPLTALDVTGSASFSANLSLRGAGTAHTFNILDNGTLNFQRSPGGDAGLAANSVLYLGSNGNVGIGTTGPGARLHVVGGAGVDNGIQVSMGSIANLRLTRTDATAQTYIVRTENDRTFRIIDETASGTPTRFLIDTSGNVGIGTGSPVGVLHVSGIAAGNAAAIINNAGTVGDIFTASSSGTPRFVIRNDGNVGIGIAIPSQKLHIVSANGALGLLIGNPADTSTYTAGIAIQGADDGSSSLFVGYPRSDGNGTPNDPNTGISVKFRRSGELGAFVSSGALTFATGVGATLDTFPSASQERIRIDSAGNVGIGTTSPGSILDLQAAGGALTGGTMRDILRIENTTATATNNSANMSFFNLRSGAIQTPVASISGVMTDNGATTYTGALVFSTAGTAAVPTERMRIDGGGNVGIGTTAPLTLLDVRGGASASGALTLTTTPTIQSTSLQTLTIGGTTTGNIVIDSGSSAITLSDDTTITGDLAVNGPTSADITSTITTGTLFNTTVTTLSLGGAATTLNLGTTDSVTRTINLGTGTGADTINIGTGATTANTVNIGTGAIANTIAIGSSSTTTLSLTDDNWSITAAGLITTADDLAVNGGDITTSTTGTFNLVNANATTVNFAQGATTLTMGATTGTATIRNATLDLPNGSATVSGNLTLYGAARTIATTALNTLTLGGTTTGNIVIDSGSSAITLADDTTFSGDIAVNGGDITTTAATFNLVNAATTLNIGSTNIARTVNLGTGTEIDTINIGTGATGVDVIRIGQAAADLALTDANWSITTAGLITTADDLAVNGGDITTSTTGTFNLVNANATTVNFAQGATTLTMGATTGTATIRNATLDLPNGSATVSGNLTLYGAARTIQTTALNTLTIGGTTTGNIVIDSGSSRILLSDALNAGGAAPAAYNYFASDISGVSTPEGIADLYVQDELEVDGTTRFNNLTYTWPTTQTVNYFLSTNGSGTLTWSDMDTNVGNFWRQFTGVLYPANSTVDLLVGATSTASAKFGFLNVNSGTPTATISANSGNNATTLTGLGVLSTTNMQTLTLGTSTTGNIVIDSGSSAITLSDDTTITGDLAVNGPTSADITSTTTTGTLFNTTVTTLSMGGAATTLNLGTTDSVTRTINLGTGTGADTINIGTGATTANTVNIGTGAVANTIAIGSSSTTTLSLTDDNWSITAAGVTLMSLGSVGAPSYSFTGDTNNGIWSSAADTLNFSTAGSERIRIDSGGNVGIGTTAPAFNANIMAGTFLTVHNAASRGVLELSAASNTNTNPTGILVFSNNNNLNTDSGNRKRIAEIRGDIVTADANASGNSGGDLVFSTKPDTSSLGEQMRITGAGNVGIKNTTPLRELDVTGSASLSADMWFRGAGTAHTFNILQNGTLNFQRSPGGDAGVTNVMYLGSNGNVGIGTTAPGSILDLQAAGGALTGGTMRDILRIENTTATATNNSANMSFFNLRSGAIQTPVASISGVMTDNGATTYTGALVFSTAGTAAIPTERMRINASGNVGIGTTAPGTTLDVRGNITILADSDIRPTADSATAINIANAAGTDFMIFNTTASTIGIGTTPSTSSRLTVGGTFSERVFLDVNGTMTPGINSTARLVNVEGTIVEAASGTHGLIAGILLTAPIITGGDAAVTNTATLYIAGAPSATVTGGNFALWVDAGTSRFDGNVYMAVDSGNVGIGTTSPGSILDLQAAGGALTGGTMRDILRIENTTATATGNSANMSFFNLRSGAIQTPVASISGVMTDNGATTYTGALVFSTAGTAAVPTERMRIDGGGNVGIGTTSPGTVNANNAAGTAFHISGTTGTIVADGSTQSQLLLNHNGGTANSRLVRLYSVDGTLQISPMNDNFTVKNVGIYMSTAGNVGIGITAPLELLHVAGNATASGNLTLSGAARTIQTTALNTLTIGGTTTGNIVIDSGSSAITLSDDTTITGNLAVNGPTSADITSTTTTGTLFNTTVTTLSMGGAATTLNLGTTDSVTRTINLGTGTGADTINIGTGATTANTVNIGTGAVANTIAIGSSSTTGLSLTDDNWSVSAAGVTLMSLGSVGAPSYSFTGDTNNGIWSSAADTLNFSTAGSERIRINSGGNVGIGTTAPASLLDVQGTVTINGASITLSQDTNFVLSGGVNGVSFDTNVLSVDATNNRVGVGTTAPGSTFSVTTPTDTNDAVSLGSFGGRFSIVNVNAYGIMMGIFGNGNVFQQVQRVDGTATAYNLMLQPAGGNVGIGNTTPLTALDVTGSASLSANMWFRGSGTAHTFNILDNGTLNFQRWPSGDAANNSTVLFLQNNGNVGIGTTAPGSILDLQAAGGALTGGTMRDILRIENTTATATGNSANMSFFNLRSGAIQTPVASISGVMTDNGATTYTGALVFSTAGTAAIPTERMRIDGGGNVGIGDSSPLALLTVGSGDLFQVDSSGRVFLPAGANGAGTLALSFVGDTNTGLFNQAADTLSVALGGTERLRYSAAAFAFQEATTVSTTANNNLTVTAGGTGQLLLGANSTTYLTIDPSNADNIDTVAISRTVNTNADRHDVLTVTGSGSRNNVDASTVIVRGIVSLASVKGDNTKNLTNTVGMRAIEGQISTLTGGTGELTGGASFYATNAVASGATIKNQYGLYIESLTAATNNYGVFFAGNPNGGSISSAASTNISIMPGSGGNVGIGTTSPGSILDLQAAGGALTGGTMRDILRIENTTATATNNSANMSFFNLRSGAIQTPVASISGVMTDNGATTYTGALVFSTAGTAAVPTERMRIDGAGNVGIGTTGPGARLHVVGGAGVDNGIQVSMGSIANLRLTRTDATAQTYIVRTENDRTFRIIDETASGTPTRFLIDTSGNVGIGTGSPVGVLHVSGIAAGNAAAIINNAGTVGDIFTASSSGTSRFVITNAGNVGIGTTAPALRLDVQDSQSATAAAQIFNTNTGTDADGLIVKLGNTSTTVVSSTNHFISFETSGIGIVGSVQGSGGRGVTYATSGIADFAEYFKKDPTQTIEYGSVVCLNQNGLAVPCDNNSNKIIGVASERPAFLGGENLGDRSIAVGLVGLVETFVSTASGEILSGDALSASSIPGVAVKATKAGQIVGKAVEGFEGAEGKILVSVNIGWYDPSIYIASDGTLGGVPAITAPTDAELASQGEALQAQTASTSASLAAQTNYVLENDSLFKDLKGKVAALESKFDLLNLQFDQQASISGLLASQGEALRSWEASTSAALALGDLELNNATISDNLMVLGRTTVTDLGVTGNINAGLLAMHGLTGEINTLSGYLYLQKAGLGGVDILAGKVVIDTVGNMTVAGTITAKQIQAENYTVLGQASIGSATIPAGSTSIEIATLIASESSKIFLTSTSLTDKQITVVQKSIGRFKVAIPQPTTSPISFDWWIVGNK